jgi:hypothetical protein
MAFWVIQFTAENPSSFLAEGGGLTYQFAKARRYRSKEDAEKRIKELQMSPAWQAVGYSLETNASASSRTNDRSTP